MANYNNLAKLDTGEYIEIKNLWMGNVLPYREPFVLESLLTREEMREYLMRPPFEGMSMTPSDDERDHRLLIVETIFAWTRYDRVIYMVDDHLMEWKYGESPVDAFSPRMKPQVELFATWDADQMREFLARTAPSA